MFPDSSILLQSATSIAPDVRVQIIFYIFSVNAILSLGCMLFAAIPYYHYFGHLQSQNGLIVAGLCFVLLYAAMIFSVSKRALRSAIFLGILWWGSCIAIVGFLSALLVNIAPLQFMAIAFAQSISIVIQTRISPRNISINYSMGIMSVATLIAWGLSVYGFIVEADWAGGIVVLLVGAALVGYNTQAIRNTEAKYDASWEQGVTAVFDYYSCYGEEV
jgi:hypothetical protein